MYYTGVGSRKTSPDDLELLQRVGERMAALGYTLRSGAAEGADMAFQQGACQVNQNLTEIWLPWGDFNSNSRLEGNYQTVSEDQVKHAGKRFESLAILPQWKNMKNSVQMLHGRNYYQVVGVDGRPNSRVCIYAAPEKNGQVFGGTRSAVLLSRYLGIPTLNVTIPEQKEQLLLKLKMKP